MMRANNLNQKILNTPGQPTGHIPFPAFAINPTGLPLTQVSPSGIQWEQSDGNSKYNALLVSLEKRYAQGLSLVLSYTWSKGLADYTGNLDSGFRNGSPQDNLNRRNDWGLQAMDTPHRFVASATYALPFGRSATSRGMRLLGGWQVNGILTFASGQPIGIGAPYDASQTGTGERANCVGNKNGGPKTVDQWFDTSGYFVPPIYTFGTCSPTPGPRNPGINNLDASLFKDFTITERVKLQFRAESYNFVNHPQFGPPNGGCSASISSTNPTGACAGSGSFGSISSLNVNVTPRQIQFGLKLIF